MTDYPHQRINLFGSHVRLNQHLSRCQCLSETMTFIQAAPRFSQMEKIIYFWQLQKKDKMKADVRITCDLTLQNSYIVKLEKKQITLFCRQIQ